MDLQDQFLFSLPVLLGFFFLWGENKEENKTDSSNSSDVYRLTLQECQILFNTESRHKTDP